jgi:NAD(P)-dependent dehydrogenase (short-subunit alcohol dehydrogenase family)
MSITLKGEALVTGAGADIGLATAQAFASRHPYLGSLSSSSWGLVRTRVGLCHVAVDQVVGGVEKLIAHRE